MEVKSVLTAEEGGAEASLRDIKAPLSIASPIPGAWVIAALLLLLVIAGVLLWLRYRQQHKKAIVAPALPPHERALVELARIARMDLLATGQMKEYYYLVSSCLRLYLEERFSLRAPEQTTEEFLLSVVERDTLQGAQINALNSYLKHCDLVKYAKLDPEELDRDQLMKTTRTFIEETKPVQETAAGAEVGS